MLYSNIGLLQIYCMFMYIQYVYVHVYVYTPILKLTCKAGKNA